VHKSYKAVAPLAGKNVPQINIIDETPLPNSEQKFVFSNVLSIAFSHATHVPHNPLSIYTSLPQNTLNHDLGIQRNFNGIDTNSSKRS
jgi:hypothetical protein